MKIGRYTEGYHGSRVRVSYTFASSNSKTGDVIQQWITPADWEGDRSKKIDTKASESVCNDCPLLKKCYVKKGHAGMGLKSSSKSTNFENTHEQNRTDLFEGKFIRFGAFGEPVLAGEQAIKSLSEVAKNWTGYTHQWRLPSNQWAKKYLMASCDHTDYEEAIAMGWRPFIVIPKGTTPPKNAVNCPASKEAGKKVTCKDCGLCKGTSIGAKPVWIYEH